MLKRCTASLHKAQRTDFMADVCQSSPKKSCLCAIAADLRVLEAAELLHIHTAAAQASTWGTHPVLPAADCVICTVLLQSTN